MLHGIKKTSSICLASLLSLLYNLAVLNNANYSFKIQHFIVQSRLIALITPYLNIHNNYVE